MNAERLLAHYEKIADAPDAIARLRRFVLDLAVRGKLVPQDASDEPASELLKRLKHERTRLEKLKAIKRIKLQYGPIALDTDFKLPSGWVKATIGETCDLQTGATPDRNRPEFFGGDIRWLVSGDINRGEIFDCAGRITKLGLDNSNCKILPQNCVLIALNGQGKTRATVALLRTQAACNQSLVAIIPLLPSDFTPEYLHLSLKARYVAIRELTGKDERRGLNMRLLECFEIAIPPLAEQRRIVAKVDELMALCDRLEAARREREATRDRMAAASLARLNAPDPETFRDDARFALDALPALTARADQIKQLRQTILNLAVRGKLVPQDPNDEPAAELLKDISKTRKMLYAEKRIPKPKELPSIDELDLPFAMPSGWAWSMLGNLCYQVSDGPHFSPQYVAAEDGVPFLSARNIRLGSFDLSTVKHVSRADHEEFCKRIRPEKDDIIYTKGGTTGIAKVNDLDFEFSVWVHLAVLRIEKKRLYPRYVELALNSPHCYAQSQQYTQGTSNFDLGLTRMIKITIPLPPLAEQHRIVAKVDALMVLCDRLEASLAATAATRRRLLDALLVEALAPADARELEAAE